LNNILTTLLEDILFNSPDNLKEKDIVISANDVNDKLKTIVQNKDLSKFIL
jgi:ATP-dependent HslUV protease ATP-binding subunit HslU